MIRDPAFAWDTTATPTSPPTPTPTPTSTSTATRRDLLLLGLLAFTACGRSEILHGLEEREANRAVVALDEASVRAEVRRDAGSEGGFVVEVPSADAARARQVLVARELPREGPTGFAAAFGKGSVVPTAVEERARLLQALAGELGRTLEALDGVVEARVHLALPPEDPIRAAPPAAPPRAAALVKVRPASRAHVEALAPGLRALVAGAVPGLEPERVSVVLADAPAPPPAPPAAAPQRRAAVALASLAAVAALLLLGRAALRGRIRLPRRAP